MATEWYCDFMGRVVGPLTAAELLEKVRRGEVSENTSIRKDNSKWFPAGQVTGLFDAAFGKGKTSRRSQPRVEFEEDL